MYAEAIGSWVVAILLGLSFYFCGMSFNSSISIVLKSLGLIAALIFIYRGFYYWNKPRTETPITAEIREDFVKGFFRHLMWSSAILLMFGLAMTAKNVLTKETALTNLNWNFELTQYKSAWIGLCGPYLFLQLGCYLIYRRFFYLAFTATYLWVPKGYQHDPKDGIFSGLWFLLVMVLVVTFPGLWRT